MPVSVLILRLAGLASVVAAAALDWDAETLGIVVGAAVTLTGVTVAKKKASDD